MRIVKGLEEVKEVKEVKDVKDVKENARAAQWREGRGEWPDWCLRINYHITT